MEFFKTGWSICVADDEEASCGSQQTKSLNVSGTALAQWHSV